MLLWLIGYRATAEALTRGETIPPESFASVTIFFSDIVGFADLCSRISPLAVLETLNSLYHWSDTIMENYDVYKVEAIADIFMVYCTVVPSKTPGFSNLKLLGYTVLCMKYVIIVL